MCEHRGRSLTYTCWNLSLVIGDFAHTLGRQKQKDTQGLPDNRSSHEIKMTENHNRCKVLASTQMYTLMHAPAPKYAHTQQEDPHTAIRPTHGSTYISLMAYSEELQQMKNTDSGKGKQSGITYGQLRARSQNRNYRYF